MDLAEIENGIRQLTVQERHRLSALLLALEDEDSPAQQQWLSQKMDASGVAQWILAEQVLRDLPRLEDTHKFRVFVDWEAAEFLKGLPRTERARLEDFRMRDL